MRPLRCWWITPTLAIRGMFDKDVDRVPKLREAGVTLVISMLRKSDPELPTDGIAYLKFPLPDTGVVDKDAAFGAAWAATKHLRDQRGKVLIHCISARDRSPLAAALTLWFLEPIDGATAMARVRAVKPTTFRNDAFRAFLEQLPAAVSYADQRMLATGVELGIMRRLGVTV